MATSYVEYTADGVEDTFEITFDYISASHVEVYLRSGAESFAETVDFSIVGTDVVLDTPPADGDTVRVARNSGRNDADPSVTFATGRLRSEDLNTIALQLFYMAIESYEQGSTESLTELLVVDEEITALDDRITALESLSESGGGSFVYTVSTSTPTSEDGDNGEFWFVREA